MKHSKILVLNAMFLIASCAVSTGALGQKVYRCGASYSQAPCPDAVALDADDARSKAQKTQADQTIARDVKTANVLGKTRLKEEEEAAARNQTVIEGGKSNTTKSKTKTEKTAQKKSKKKKEPEFFTAKAVSEKKKEPSKSAN